MKILDHGSLELVGSWGSEEQIITAARMSTGKGFQGWGPKHREGCVPGFGGDYDHCSCGRSAPGDEKLLRYLYENKHHTPFEMAGATFEVQAPIFVFREWHRHRVPFSYNEMSARYTPLPDVNYVPSVDRLMLRSAANKQTGVVPTAEELTEANAQSFQKALALIYSEAEALYQRALSAGVPKELARVHLPVGRYSRMRASSNLRGWLNFLTLRMAPNAQWEIRQYAEAVHTELTKQFPRTLALFDEGRR